MRQANHACVGPGITHQVRPVLALLGVVAVGASFVWASSSLDPGRHVPLKTTDTILVSVDGNIGHRGALVPLPLASPETITRGDSQCGVVAKYASYFPTLEYAVAFNKYQNLQNIPLIDKFVDAYSV